LARHQGLDPSLGIVLVPGHEVTAQDDEGMEWHPCRGLSGALAARAV
jgi:hypothetical protein